MHSAYKKQLLKLTYVNKEKKHIKSILTWMNQQQFNHLKFFGVLFAPHLLFWPDTPSLNDWARHLTVMKKRNHSFLWTSLFLAKHKAHCLAYVLRFSSLSRERQHSQMQWPCRAAWKRFQKTHLRLQLKFYTIATNAVGLLLLINELYVNNSYEDRCLQPWNNCKPQIVIVYCYCKIGYISGTLSSLSVHNSCSDI